MSRNGEFRAVLAEKLLEKRERARNTAPGGASDILARLIGQLGDFDLAEDALQEALVAALEHWPRSGLPRNPVAWLFVAARRKALDRLRRGQRWARVEETLQQMSELEHDESEAMSDDQIPDDRLKLIMTCCHPALSREAQVAQLLSRRATNRERPAYRPVWHGAWQVVRHPRGPVPRLIWIYAAGMLGFTAMTSVLALYLDAEFGVTEKNIGWVFLYVATLSLVMRSLLLGTIVRRLGEPGTMRAGTICLTLGLVLYPITHSVWVLAPVMALVPIGTALLFPATTALMSHASEKAEVGTTMGVAQTFAGLSRVVAPLIATSAFQRFGSPAPFYLAGAIVMGVGVLAFRLDVAPHALRESDAA